MGRIDHQVKIRGFRIELGEIEKRLLHIDGIKEAAVTVRDEPGKDKYICAYIVSPKKFEAIELREHLLKRLPAFMVPAYFISLEKIPLTAHGKLDLRALPKPSLSMGRSYLAPRNEIEKKLVEIWAEVLNIEKDLISIDSSFFELGGNSLKAIQLLAILQKDFEVSLTDIFQHQTILNLAVILPNKKANFKQKIEELKQRAAQNINEQELMETREVLEPQEQAYLSNLEKYRTIELSNRILYRAILLTGAAGYLGIHILKELLTGSNADIYLLLRGNAAPELEQRLLGKLHFYFDEELYDLYRGRIHILNGDITQDRFGLSAEKYQQLSGEIDCIINSAALVKHFGPYEDFLHVNVEGVGRLIEFAFAGKKKDLKHISTIGIGSGQIKGKKFSLFSEFDHDIGQLVGSYYLLSKLKGELLIEEARTKGLNAAIFRVGNLVFQSGTGRFQENIEDNAFYNLLKSFIKIGITIESDEAELDFSFIDQTAKAFALMYDRESLLGETHHLYNSNKICPNEFAMMLREIGENLKTVTVNEFLDILQNNYENPGIKNYIERLVSHTLTFSSSSDSITNIKTVSEKTELILDRLGFQWPKLNKDHAAKMLSYCKKVGFI
ncbi:MAG: SDR family oxidoreductase [Acidobacteria bacterium]|nr:SDR family oxidoreductase [Acidobacteriota bacterium]